MIAQSNFVDLLRWRAAHQPNDPAVIILEDGERETVYSYAELDRRTRAFAASLLEHARPGDRVVLLQPFGIDFVVSFFACLYANLIGAPMYPPRNPKHMSRIETVLRDAGTRVVVTAEKSMYKIQEWLGEGAKAFHILSNEEVRVEAAAAWCPQPIDPAALAYLQYTSGSTGSPKGVMVSHMNIMANLAQLAHKLGLTGTSSFVSWLPIFHDMGLVSSLMIALYLGTHIVMMAPSSFAQKPFRWLNAISKYRGRVTGAPNFAFELCARKITEEQKAQMDLSCLELAYCASEPINPAILERFAETFAPCGLRREALYELYGLAEATLIVTGGIPNAGPVYCNLDAAALQRHQVVPLPPEDPKGYLIAGCGQSIENQRLVIVDPGTHRPLGEGEVGEVWVAGPHVSQGYWEKPKDTEETLRAHLTNGEGPFLRTGDLGFVLRGELYIAGRIKEIIIIHGRNFYPQDIEHTVAESHTALAPTDGAAFSVDTPVGERLVVTHEVQRVERRQLDTDEVISAIRQALFTEQELAPYAVVLLKPASVPKTSSGKIQRGVARRKFLEGTLEVLAEWREISPVEEELAEARPAEGEAPGRGQAARTGPASRGEPAAVSVPADPKQRRAQEILRWLGEWGGKRVGKPAFAVDPRKKMSEYGLDSIGAVEFAGDLADFLNRPLPPSIAYEFQNIQELLDFLLQDEE